MATYSFNTYLWTFYVTAGNPKVNKANIGPDILELMVQQLPREVASNLSQRVIQRNLDAYIPGKL